MAYYDKKVISSVYVASPLGFSEAGRHYYYNEFIPALKALGLEILDPWAMAPADEINTINNMPFGQAKKEAWAGMNETLGRNNAEKGLDRADIVVAILDGVDVDSGTASEIGYAAGKGKYIEGYRGDFRLSADNIGSTVNLQVEYFIHSSGGSITTTLQDLIDTIKKKYTVKELQLS